MLLLISHPGRLEETLMCSEQLTLCQECVLPCVLLSHQSRRAYSTFPEVQVQGGIRARPAPRGTKGALSASGAMNQVAGRAQRLTVAAKTNTKFSTLEKSDAMKMATAAMKGIDPRRVSKRRWVWLARRAVKEYICNGGRVVLRRDRLSPRCVDANKCCY